jgi:hypothetical protein
LISIQLLPILKSPQVLKESGKEEFQFFLDEPVNVPSSYTPNLNDIESIKIDRLIVGNKKNGIEFLDNSFVDVSLVKKIFTQIDNLSPPFFPSISSIIENSTSLSAEDLLSRAKVQLHDNIRKLCEAKNPVIFSIAFHYLYQSRDELLFQFSLSQILKFSDLIFEFIKFS